MKVLVLGGEGMLGHQVCRRLGSHFEVWATYRDDPGPWLAYGACRSSGRWAASTPWIATVEPLSPGSARTPSSTASAS